MCTHDPLRSAHRYRCTEFVKFEQLLGSDGSWRHFLPHSSSSSLPARQTAAAQESPSSSRHSTGAWRPPEAGPSSSSSCSSSSSGGGGIMNISPGLTPLKMRLLIGPKCRRRALSSSADLRLRPARFARRFAPLMPLTKLFPPCFSVLVSGGGRSPYMVSLAPRSSICSENQSP